MRILVTGADGFVGGHLLRELDRRGGHEVVAGSLSGSIPAPVRESLGKPLAVDRLDVTSDDSVGEILSRYRPEAVIHLAAQSSVGRSFADPLGTWEVNATGTLRLAQALRAGVSSRCRMLVISSAEVYGSVPADALPVREEAPIRPVTPYGASKAGAEVAALQAADGPLEVVVARSFNHAGPGQDERFVFPSMARQLARIQRGEAEPVLRAGNLEVRRDFLDVRDVVRAYLLLVERGENRGVYNVCSGATHCLRDLVGQLIELSGTGARLQVDAERFRPADIPVLYGDASRLRGLGWEPEIGLERTFRDLLTEAGLASTVEAA